MDKNLAALRDLGLVLDALLEAYRLSGHEGEENELARVFRKAKQANAWFTFENQIMALEALVQMLDEKALSRWVSNYTLPAANTREVSLIMAGNIPAVGMHDAFCVLLAGHSLSYRPSASDSILPAFLFSVLGRIDDSFRTRVRMVDKVIRPEVVIATGSSNTSRYFEYYFSSVPHLIRRNRSSVAVLSGRESREELIRLGRDIFSYFGLGCRNVSKLYVPAGYDFTAFFEAITPYGEGLMQHNKYMNNYDYHQAIFLLNSDTFLTNNFLLLRQNAEIFTPVSVLNYEYYDELPRVEADLGLQADKIQVRIGAGGVPFGMAQFPGPDDYADGVDTLNFLLQFNDQRSS